LLDPVAEAFRFSSGFGERIRHQTALGGELPKSVDRWDSGTRYQCSSKPPKGRVRWTLRLLENKVVELGIVDRASDSTIGRTLKKTLSSPIAASSGSSRRRPTARS
jgi:hypothetical protein